MSYNKFKTPKVIISSFLISLVFICLLTNITKTSNLHAPGVFESDYGKNLDIPFEIYENDEFITSSSLPYSFASSTQNKRIKLISTLPDDTTIDNSFLFFRASGYSVIVEVDGNEIYNFSKENVKDFGGGYKHFIRLPENSSSKEIVINLFCPSANPFSQNLYPIEIGSKGYVLRQAFGPTYESLFFGIILIVLGIIFLGNIIFFKESMDNSFIFSLSLLLICLGVWVFFQASSRQLVGINNPSLPMILSFFAMFSLPFCLWFYTKTNYLKFDEYNILKYSAFFILALYIPISIADLFGMSYMLFLPFIGMLILLYSILLLIISIHIYIKGEKSVLSCILSISSIFISIILEEILLLLKLTIGNISILHLGMSITAIIFIYRTIGNLIDKSTKANEAKLLEKLAFFDVATLVENRNAYERFLEENSNKVEYAGVFLADINGLKIINDYYGHKQGDTLLKNLSSSLKESLPKNSKLYRIGGDEFVGIIISISEKNFTKYIEDLRSKFNPSDNNFGMAIGFHYHKKELDSRLERSIEKADMNMYQQKEFQKHLIHKSLLEKTPFNKYSTMRET
jgi:diguanylate cyclase (GGDEF)-like protein